MKTMTTNGGCSFYDENAYLFLNNNPKYQKTAAKCSFVVRKVIFAHGELMFTVHEHMFMGGEHKFVGHEYKIDVWQIKKHPE